MPMPGFGLLASMRIGFTHATWPVSTSVSLLPGRRELQRDARAHFERLVGAHEDPDLGDVRDVRVEERVLRFAIDRPRHVDAIGAAPIRRRPLGQGSRGFGGTLLTFRPYR